jgi:nitrile hydratase
MKTRFAPGDGVRVQRRFPPGHVRTPWYCRGKSGKVERICGSFPNPEQLAYGNRDAEREVLYRVSFPSRVLWPDYEGSAGDRVEIEIYEHWLGPLPGGTQ